jgi:hypothetical protein
LREPKFHLPANRMFIGIGIPTYNINLIFFVGRDSIPAIDHPFSPMVGCPLRCGPGPGGFRG